MRLRLHTLVSTHEVYWHYLVAEKHKLLSPQGPEQRFFDDFLARTTKPLSYWLSLLETPDLPDAQARRDCKTLLFQLYKRGVVLSPLPQETRWAHAEIIDSSDLSNLFSIHDTDSNPQGLLSSLAPRYRGDPRYQASSPQTWPSLLFWTHDPQEGPFTILEGNHRLIGFFNAFQDDPSLSLVGFSRVFVGFCDEPCSYHPPDVESDPQGLLAATLDQIKMLDFRKSYLTHRLKPRPNPSF